MPSGNGSRYTAKAHVNNPTTHTHTHTHLNQSPVSQPEQAERWYPWFCSSEL